VRQLLLSTELLVGVCVLAVVLYLAWTFARRRLIAHGEPLTLCAIRDNGQGPWRFGLARYASGRVEWFPLGGVRVRPSRRWERTRLEIGSPRPLDPREKPTALIKGAVGVGCAHRLERFDLAMAPGPYTALRSWLEASPPGRNVNVA
jgi:Protein of unknown function (DUF2550)